MRPNQRALVRNLLRKWLGNREMERLQTIVMHDEGFGYDIFGLERESAFLAFAVARLFYRYYFRVESQGVESVPTEGRAILASNHSGVLPIDGAMIGVDVATKLEPPRLIRSMVDYFAFAMPYAGVAMTRIGQIPGTRRNFEEIMRRDELLCVFPEGHKGTGKLFKDRYRLLKFNVGHVELSLEYKAPIVPVAVIGAEEQAPLLGNFKPLARLLGLPYFPITPTFPWFGPLGALPLPVKYHIYYGKPLRLWEQVTEEEARDPETVQSLADSVRGRVAELIEQGLQERKGVFL